MLHIFRALPPRSLTELRHQRTEKFLPQYKHRQIQRGAALAVAEAAKGGDGFPEKGSDNLRARESS